MGKDRVEKRDLVNSPKHYASSADGIECIDAIRAALGDEQFIGFLRGNIIKYQWRMGKKESAIQDNEKAIWYLKKLNTILSEMESKGDRK